MSESVESQFETWAAGFLSRLDAGARRKLAGEIGKALRRSQIERVRRQESPTGEPYAPRRPRYFRGRQGAIRRGAMFRKLATTRHMKVQLTPDGVAVGFFGRVARLARVHHEGQEDVVTRGGPTHRYAARPLIGFSDADRSLIRDLLIEHLKL